MQMVMRSAAAAALLMLAPVAAQAEGQAFVAVSGGQARHSTGNARGGNLADYGFNYTSNTDKKDATFGVTGGYRWTVDESFSIGPEAGFVDLGELTTKAFLEAPGYFTESVRGSRKSKAALLGVNARWKLDRTWWIGVRTGFARMWIRTESTISGASSYPLPASSFTEKSRETTHDTGFYGALNVGYDFDPHTGISLGYEHYHSEYRLHADGFASGKIDQNIGAWTASFEYRF